jgi:hypothetical protein
MTYREMYEKAKEIYEENEFDYEHIGLRFGDKKREVGEICDNSRSNRDREDVRDFPEYGTDEYWEMEDLGGTCAYDLSDSRTYEIHEAYDGMADQPAESVCARKHAFIIAGDLMAMGDPEDEGEVIIENAKVIANLF